MSQTSVTAADRVFARIAQSPDWESSGGSGREAIIEDLVMTEQVIHTLKEDSRTEWTFSDRTAIHWLAGFACAAGRPFRQYAPVSLDELHSWLRRGVDFWPGAAQSPSDDDREKRLDWADLPKFGDEPPKKFYSTIHVPRYSAARVLSWDDDRLLIDVRGNSDPDDIIVVSDPDDIDVVPGR